MPKLNEYLTVAQATQVLGVSKDSLRRWDKAGKLKARRHSVTQYRLYLRDDLEAFLQGIESTTANPRHARKKRRPKQK